MSLRAMSKYNLVQTLRGNLQREFVGGVYDIIGSFSQRLMMSKHRALDTLELTGTVPNRNFTTEVLDTIKTPMSRNQWPKRTKRQTAHPIEARVRRRYRQAPLFNHHRHVLISG